MAQSIYYFTDSQEMGGAEHALLLLLENLDRREWQPTLLYNENAALAPLVDQAGELDVEVRAVPALPLGLVGARRVPGFVRDLRHARPDVFHAHLSWPLAAKFPLLGAILTHRPAVVATVQLFSRFRLDRSSYVQERVLARGVDRYIAVSRDIAGKLVEVMHWPTRKIEVIHNGVRVEPVQHGDPAVRRELTGGVDRAVVLTAARLDPQKGLDILVRAAADVPEARFVVAGDGRERAGLHAAIGERGLGDRVVLLGHRNDIPSLLAASDVFVLPSLYEGSSLAILEAMAAGKAVIASRIGGTDELIVEEESGLLVPPSDSVALAAAVRRVLGDADLRGRLGAAARERVQRHFSAHAVADRTTRLYEELLAGNEHGSA
jgi:glycosyltransferase involved in cell wall biosynthesis